MHAADLTNGKIFAKINQEKKCTCFIFSLVPLMPVHVGLETVHCSEGFPATILLTRKWFITCRSTTIKCTTVFIWQLLLHCEIQRIAIKTDATQFTFATMRSHVLAITVDYKVIQLQLLMTIKKACKKPHRTRKRDKLQKVLNLNSKFLWSRLESK